MLTEDALKYIRSFAGYTPVEPAPDQPLPSKVLAVPGSVALKSLERFQATPNRIKHTATLVSSAAFMAYVNRFKGPETSVYLDIFGGTPSFAALLDHHGTDSPSWLTHRATFAPKVSLEWKAWTVLHKGGPIDQGELVAFVEDHYNDFLSPQPTQMLQVAQRFEAVETHKYTSAVNLDNGNMEVAYVKDGSTKKVQFPHELQVEIPVFENETPIVLDARLRYRTNQGALTFVFAFKQDPDRILRDELRRMATLIGAGIEGAHLYEGVTSARSPASDDE